MDIQAIQASRLRWLDIDKAGAASDTRQTTSTTTETTGSDTGLVGFHGAPTGKTMEIGGLTATNHSMVEGLTATQEAPPDAAGVEADRKAVGNALQMALAIAGIQASPPIEFNLNGTDIEVEGDDPRAAQIKAALDSDPALKERLGTLIGDAQEVEQAAAKAGWLKQVNGGVSQKNADRNLKNAMDQIGKATGFTLDGDELNLESTGMGERLMQADAAPPSDDERMWRETLRLTDRMGTSGVIGAAAAAQAEEDAAERSGQTRIGLRLGGEQPDLKDGGSAAQTVKAA